MGLPRLRFKEPEVYARDIGTENCRPVKFCEFYFCDIQEPHYLLIPLLAPSCDVATPEPLLRIGDNPRQIYFCDCAIDSEQSIDTSIFRLLSQPGIRKGAQIQVKTNEVIGPLQKVLYLARIPPLASS